MPYFDSSGWFLIEKTTILTNSCCLHVQPTFGYLRGSAFGSAAEPKVGWFSLSFTYDIRKANGSLASQQILTQSSEPFARKYGKGVCTCARAVAPHL